MLYGVVILSWLLVPLWPPEDKLASKIVDSSLDASALLIKLSTTYAPPCPIACTPEGERPKEKKWCTGVTPALLPKPPETLKLAAAWEISESGYYMLCTYTVPQTGTGPDMPNNTTYRQLLDNVLVANRVWIRAQDDIRSPSCMELCYVSIWYFQK